MANALTFLHQGGVSVVELEDGKKLTSSVKPDFGFDYDEITYTETSEVFTYNGSVFNLTFANKQNIDSFLSTVMEDKEAGMQIATNSEARNYLASTDWKVLRHLREIALGKATSLNEEEYIALESERERISNQVVEVI